MTASYIPISQYTGHGIRKLNPQVGWYDGKCVIDSIQTLKPKDLDIKLSGPCVVKPTSKYMCYVCNCDEEVIASGLACEMYIDRVCYKIQLTNVRNKTHQKYVTTGNTMTCYVKYVDSKPTKVDVNRIILRHNGNTVGYCKIA